MKKQINRTELRFSKLLYQSWLIYKKKLKLILFLGLITYVPANLLLMYLIKYTDLLFLNKAWNFKIINSDIMSILLDLFSIFLTVIIIYVVKAKIDEQSSSFVQIFKKAILKLRPVYVTEILKNLLFIILIITPVIMVAFIPNPPSTYLLTQQSSYALFAIVRFLSPWLQLAKIIISFFLMFSIYAVIFHNKIAFSAFSYSWQIIKKEWAKIVKYLLGTGIIILIISLPFLLTNILVNKYILTPESTQSLMLKVLLNSIVNIIAIFGIIFNTLLFVNLDISKSNNHSKTSI